MYTMMQVCRELDMTYQTLKFYCNEGLVPNVKRDHNNRRLYSKEAAQPLKIQGSGGFSCSLRACFPLSFPFTDSKRPL